MKFEVTLDSNKHVLLHDPSYENPPLLHDSSYGNPPLLDDSSYENIVYDFLSHLLMNQDRLPFSYDDDDKQDLPDMNSIQETEIVPYPSTCSHICVLCSQKYSEESIPSSKKCMEYMKSQKISNYIMKNKYYSFYRMWTTIFLPFFYSSLLQNTKLIK
jgi:hypothetical protein